MLPMRSMVRVEVEAVEEPGVEVLAILAIVEEVGVMQAQRLANGYEKARRAAGRVADRVLGRGLGQFDHQLNDVARGAELAVLPGGGYLREHVLVEVALGVAALHGQRGDEIDHLDQQRRGGDGETGILHVLGVGGAVAAQGAQEGKDVLADQFVEVASLEILELGPAEIGVGPPLVVFPCREEAPFHGDIEGAGLLLFENLEIVQAAKEEKVGDLLDHFQRIRDAAGPERVPQAVNLIAKFSGYHSGWGPFLISYSM